MKSVLLFVTMLMAGCSLPVKPIAEPLHVDSYYISPCDGAAKLPERPVKDSEILEAHAKTVQALAECSKKQAGAAIILQGLSTK